MDEGGTDAHRQGQPRVEGRQRQLLVQQTDKQQIEDQDTRQDPHRTRSVFLVVPQQRIEGCVGNLSVQDALLIEIDLSRVDGDQHDAQGEQRSEDDADTGIFGDGPASVECFHEQGREQTEDGSANEHGQDGARIAQKEGNRDAGQHGVAQRVTEKGHFAQHEKRPQ